MSAALQAGACVRARYMSLAIRTAVISGLSGYMAWQVYHAAMNFAARFAAVHP